jgi:hypothetical protein
MYRCETKTIEGFVQQVAVNYVGRGYYFYVTGVIPERKDARAIDRKIISQYGIDERKWTRARRKKGGLANLQYIRHGRFFVILATHGKHAFFEEEKGVLKDIRETPLKFASYAIGYRGGHPSVRIERGTYLELKAHFLGMALWSREKLERLFWNFPFEPWAPVRKQRGTIFRRVNERRRLAGFEQLDYSCLRMRRIISTPFEESGSQSITASAD